MRNKEIDFLRGIAVLLVLFRHHLFFAPLKSIGWIGVDLFFVLSGFLVSGLLFEEFKKKGKVNVLNFFIRRGFKIYPSFYIFLLASFLLEGYFGFPVSSRNQYLSEGLFVQNYFYPIWNHTWSLAVEEHFYIFLPLLILLLVTIGKMDNKLFFLTTIGLLIFLVFLFRLWKNISVPYDMQTHSFATHLRIDGLLFGVLLSYLNSFYSSSLQTFISKYAKIILVLFLVAILMPLLIGFESFVMNTVGYTVLYVAFGGALIAMLHKNEIAETLKRVITLRVYTSIARIGFYSYSIYLWHMLVNNFVNYYLPWPRFNSRISFIPYFILSILLGILFSIIIEQNFIKIREKLFPKKWSNK